MILISNFYSANNEESCSVCVCCGLMKLYLSVFLFGHILQLLFRVSQCPSVVRGWFLCYTFYLPRSPPIRGTVAINEGAKHIISFSWTAAASGQVRSVFLGADAAGYSEERRGQERRVYPVIDCVMSCDVMRCEIEHCSSGSCISHGMSETWI